MRLRPSSNLCRSLQRSLGSRRVAVGALLLISLSAALPLTASTPYGGALISPDSVHYLAASQSLLRLGDYLRYDDLTYTTWTPLYPTLLAGVSVVARVFDIPFINAVRAWQLAIYCAVIFAAGLWRCGWRATSCARERQQAVVRWRIIHSPCTLSALSRLCVRG